MLHVPSEINGDSLNNIRREASEYFSKKGKQYFKDRIIELAMSSENRNIGDLY
jgi:hypothetical protein